MIKENKIVGIVILYFPDLNIAIDNILKYIYYIDKLLIWDNSPYQNKLEIKIPDYDQKVIYMTTGRNEGIAYPINKCIEWAQMNHYSYILTMDQDSTWVDFNKYYKMFSNIISKGSKCIVSPNVNGSFHSFKDTEKVDTFIISGTILPLEIINLVGKLNNELFVDCVDLDFSYRLKQNNIDILLLPACVLIQRFGIPIKLRLKTYSSYTADRTSNIVKNHVLIIRRYYSQISVRQILGYILEYVIRRAYRILLYEDKKAKKIGAIIKGLHAGIRKSLSETFI